MKTMLTPKMNTVPRLIIYSKKFVSKKYGPMIQYNMADTITGEFAGKMYARPVMEDFFSPYYPTLGCYKSFKIEYIQTEETNQGYGRAFIKLAKAESRKHGCEGRVHLDASRIYTPTRPPHIFYRKCDFTSVYTDRIKYIDECIKEHKEMHWSMADNLPMYLSLESETPQKVKIYSKLLNFVKKVRNIFK